MFSNTSGYIFLIEMNFDNSKLNESDKSIESKINIEDYFQPSKLKEMYDRLVENSNKVNSNKTNKTNVKLHKELMKSLESDKLKPMNIQSKSITSDTKTPSIDPKILDDKIKTTIRKLEDDANHLANSIDFTVNPLTETERVNCKTILYYTKLYSEVINQFGVSTDTYITKLTNKHYSTKEQIKESLLDNGAKQLVYISRLSKQLQHSLLTHTDTSLKFEYIHFMICDYFKNKTNQINNYKCVYQIFRETCKKLLISSLSDVELAFRSNGCWINESFKQMILKDVVMLQTLPTKLSKSWKIFVTELCQTNSPTIYNDISKLDYIIHVDQDFVIEATLARSIKCMTPCFIYNYYAVVRSLYLLCGLLDDWLDTIKLSKPNSDEPNNSKITDDELSQQLVNIGKVICYIYENTRLQEHSTCRNLPYYKDKISEELVMYYLNHTIKGPQYMILREVCDSIKVLRYSV